MATLAVLLGVVLVGSVTADMVNTLVTTTTWRGRFWLTSILYRRTWWILRAFATTMGRDRLTEALLGFFAPVSVLLLLVAWVTQQIIGFGLIWWGVGGIDGAESLFDAIYYSGVVYFTLGFGEVVPSATVPRVGALFEALSGVLTTALVIGYLPSLYGAYSHREQRLMTLDDGQEGRITPTSLLLSRAPTGEVDDVLRFFEGWEEWVSEVIETHTMFPMLRLFRSKYPGQNWVTALGLITDAALQCQVIVGAEHRAPYWMLRRSVILFDELTKDADLSEYRERLDRTYEMDGLNEEHFYTTMYQQLLDHGFTLKDQHAARAETLALRRLYDAKLEYLIDVLLAPRGFWGHQIGARIPLPAAARPQLSPKESDGL
ncbi:MAG: potassium channel family protein [Actinomycetota bacterium]